MCWLKETLTTTSGSIHLLPAIDPKSNHSAVLEGRNIRRLKQITHQSVR